MGIVGKGFLVMVGVSALMTGIAIRNQPEPTRPTPPTPAERAARDRDRIRSNVEELAQAAVLSTLRDPASARFTYMYVNLDAGVVCGEVNARNGFGGYTGDKYFMMGDPVGGLVMEDGPAFDPEKFGKMWNDRYCVTKTKERVPSGTRRLTPEQRKNDHEGPHSG